MEMDSKILCGVSALVVVICLYKLYVSEYFAAAATTIPEKSGNRLLNVGQKKGTQQIVIPQQSGTRGKYGSRQTM